MKQLAAVLFLLLTAGPASAHSAAAAHAEPGWTTDPAVLLPLGVSLVLYLIGAARLLRRSARATGLRQRQAVLFLTGWLLLTMAVVSPLHELGEVSFTAHMIEHEILMLAAAPLLVLGRPLGVMLWAFPAAGRAVLGGLGRAALLRGPWRTLHRPAAATVLQAAALWLWHLPGLFDLALRQEGWHIAQHLSFLASALLFWSAMFAAARRPQGLGPAALCLFLTSLVAGALGALMAFSVSPWFARYAELGMAPFGLSPTEDQQLAGLLMWIPGGLVHAGAALALVARTLTLSGAAELSKRTAGRSS